VLTFRPLILRLTSSLPVAIAVVAAVVVIAITAATITVVVMPFAALISATAVTCPAIIAIGARLRMLVYPGVVFGATTATPTILFRAATHSALTRRLVAWVLVAVVAATTTVPLLLGGARPALPRALAASIAMRRFIATTMTTLGLTPALEMVISASMAVRRRLSFASVARLALTTSVLPILRLLICHMLLTLGRATCRAMRCTYALASSVLLALELSLIKL